MKKIKNRLRELSDDSGQTVIVAALCMLVVMGFLGFAIDIGQLRLTKRNLQNAADAAALAAGLEIRICGSTANCAAMQAAAQNALVENGMTGASFIKNCASSAGTALTLMLNSPSCAIGANDPNNGKNGYVEAVVSQVVRTRFGRFVHFDNIRLTARAEAVRKPGAPCIFALDPTGSAAISVLVGLGITSTCGIVDESSSSSALTCVVGALITAPRISVTGGVAGLLCGLSTPVKTGVPVPIPADPLAYLPKPAVGACGTSIASPYTGSAKQVNIALLGGTQVFNPGVYCGGISIGAALLSNITFKPGTYIIKQGPNYLGLGTVGGLQIAISALTTITGTGVTFYNVGPVGNFSIVAPAALGLSAVNLSAPTSGTYGGVLFYQDAANTSSGTFSANLVQGSNFEGAVYLPSASVSYAVGAISASYNILVAKQIHFDVAIASTFGSNYSALASGSPLNGDDAILIQ